MPTRAALLVCALLVGGCGARQPSNPNPLEHLDPAIATELAVELEGARPYSFGTTCGMQGDEVPIAHLVARLSADRRIDKLQLLLGHPSPAHAGRSWHEHRCR